MEKHSFGTSLLSAARNGLACLLATSLLQYAHGYARWTSFAVFSFIVALEIIGSPSLGTAMLNSFSAFIGAFQGLGLGMLVLNLLGSYVHVWSCILSTFCCGIAIVCTSCTSIYAKRISLTLSSHLFVVAYSRQEGMDRVFYPLKLGCTVLLGIGCALVAVILPFPRCATVKVKEQIVLSTQVISKAFDTLLEAFSTEDCTKAMLDVHQAKLMADKAGHIISETSNLHMVGSEAELQFTPLKLTQAFQSFSKRLEKFMMHLQFMNVGAAASASDSSYNCKGLLQEHIRQVREWADLAFGFVGLPNRHVDKANIVTIEGIEVVGNLDRVFQAIEGSPGLPCFFFLYNMKAFLLEAARMLHEVYGSPLQIPGMCPKVASASKEDPGAPKQNPNSSNIFNCTKCSASPGPSSNEHTISKAIRYFINVDKDTLIQAVKVSWALALSAVVGLQYDKKHAFWATLVVGMGFRTFNMGSIHAVTLGTVYGYLLSFWTHQHPFWSVASIAPLVIFTSLMKHSKSYPYMGSGAVLVGAIFLVGHRHQVVLNDFAMYRITHAFIGMVCLILAHQVRVPGRSKAVAKQTLALTIANTNKCLEFSIALFDGKPVCRSCILRDFKAAIGQLKSTVQSLTTVVSKLGAQEAKLYRQAIKCEEKILSLLQFMPAWLQSPYTPGFLLQNSCQEALQKPIQSLEDASLSLASLQRYLLIGQPSLCKDLDGDVESQIRTSTISLVGLTAETWSQELLERFNGDGQVLVSCGALAFAIQRLIHDVSKLSRTTLKLSVNMK